MLALWLVFIWHITIIPFTLKLSMCLYFKCNFGKQHIVEFLKNLVCNHFYLAKAFNYLTFTTITNVFVPKNTIVFCAS